MVVLGDGCLHVEPKWSPDVSVSKLFFSSSITIAAAKLLKCCPWQNVQGSLKWVRQKTAWPCHIFFYFYNFHLGPGMSRFEPSNLWALVDCFTNSASATSHTYNFLIRLKKLGIEKHSSLLCRDVRDECFARPVTCCRCRFGWNFGGKIRKRGLDCRPQIWSKI